MNKKGFTLVELLMVVIIIGILVTLAVPNYYKTIERAKAAKAKATLDLLRKAELQYQLLYDDFTSNLPELDLVDTAITPSTSNDNDWTYATLATAGDPQTFVATATRTGGGGDGSTITIDQDGTVVNGGMAEWD